MMLDQALMFLPPGGTPLSVVAAAGVTIIFPGIIDIAGVGVGQPMPNIIGFNTTFFGEDVGIGVWKPEITLNIGTAFTTGTAATGNFALQGAMDTAPSGTPGTWETFAETGPKTAAQLVASTPGHIIRMAMPPTPPDMPNPRFLRLVMLVPAATLFTAGTILSAFISQGRDDLQFMFASKNYEVL